MARLLLPLVLLALAAGCGPQEVSLDGDLEGPPEELFASLPQGLVTCDERQDTGYSSGKSFSITVVSCDGKPCERDTANAYAVMQAAAAKAGVKVVVVSGFRTMAEQQHLYSCYVNCNCNNCNLAARPGYSNHQSGHALDLNTSSPGVLNWLNAHGGAYGFKRTVPSEDWHWEWWGGGPGGGPCGLTEYGCTTGEEDNCAQFGCGCQSHACSGGFCPGPGCTAKETTACTAQGCGCVDHACSGGTCDGSGCTAKETNDCAAFGCGCVDHACSGGACDGSGCTAKETEDCGAFGCGCADHACSGGACPGDGCTASQRGGCADAGLTCGRGTCGEPLAPAPDDAGTSAPVPDAGTPPSPATLEAAVGSFGCSAPALAGPAPALALLLTGLWRSRRRRGERT